MRTRLSTTLALALAALALGRPSLVLAQPAPAPAPAAAPAAQAAPAGGALQVANLPPDSVLVRVKLVAAKPPKVTPPRTGWDPACPRSAHLQDVDLVVGKNGGLGNVLVHVSRGAPSSRGPDVELGQVDCNFRPRVLPVTAGASIRITNTDPANHQVHAYSGTRTLMNDVHPADAPPMAKSFPDEKGNVLRFKCDLHPWATAFVHVLDNPFAAVTNDRGEAVIPDLPPGTYTLTAWHERLGVKTLDLVTEPDRATEVSFTFDAAEPAKPGTPPARRPTP
jgi:plastocyanin